MAGSFQFTLTGAPIATSADPNGTAPGSLTTWATPANVASVSARAVCLDGTSATVHLWAWVSGTIWVDVATLATTTVRVAPAAVIIPAGGTIYFPQVTAAAGNPTTIAASFS